MTPNEGSDIDEVLGIDPARSRAKRILRPLVLIILIVAAAIGVMLWRQRALEAKSTKYETQPAQRGGLLVSVSATGTLQPINQVEVGSELSGIVKTVAVDYNDSVTVGQPLAALDTEKLEAQVVKSKASLELARANVLQARANVLETRNQLNRLKEVWEKTDKKAPSRHDLDAAEAASDRAQAVEAGAAAQVNEAEATLNANQTDLGKAIIRSPINGIVLSREVEPGQTVAASLQAPKLFVLAEDLTKMELHVAVDEADVGQVKDGQEAVFTVDAYPDLKFNGAVTQVRFGSQTVSGVVTYETILLVDNSDLLLRPGMTATADITVKKVDDAVLIPNAALRFSPPAEKQEAEEESGSITRKLLPRMPRRSSGEKESRGVNGERLVWTLKDNVPVSLPITIGFSDGQRTEVLSGEIEPGMPLLVGAEVNQK